MMDMDELIALTGLNKADLTKYAEVQCILHEVIGSLLDLEGDIHVIGLAENGKEALSLINSLQADICLIDIEMPVMSGL